MRKKRKQSLLLLNY